MKVRVTRKSKGLLKVYKRLKTMTQNKYIDLEKEFEEFYLNMLKTITEALGKKDVIKKAWMKDRLKRLENENK